MLLMIAQGTDENPRDMFFLFKVLVTMISVDILKSSWFNCRSFIYLLLYLLFKEIFKDPKPCLYLLFTGFPFSLNEAKTS